MLCYYQSNWRQFHYKPTEDNSFNTSSSWVQRGHLPERTIWPPCNTDLVPFDFLNRINIFLLEFWDDLLLNLQFNAFASKHYLNSNQNGNTNITFIFTIWTYSKIYISVAFSFNILLLSFQLLARERNYLQNKFIDKIFRVIFSSVARNSHNEIRSRFSKGDDIEIAATPFWELDLVAEVGAKKKKNCWDIAKFSI